MSPQLESLWRSFSKRVGEETFRPFYDAAAPFELTIGAEGYLPWSDTFSIAPGVYDPVVIELTPTSP